MSLSVFVELRFWVLVAFSLVLPAGIYGLLLATRSISRVAVLGFGVALVLSTWVGLAVAALVMARLMRGQQGGKGERPPQ